MSVMTFVSSGVMALWEIGWDKRFGIILTKLCPRLLGRLVMKQQQN